jgi:hypothetical protein
MLDSADPAEIQRAVFESDCRRQGHGWRAGSRSESRQVSGPDPENAVRRRWLEDKKLARLLARSGDAIGVQPFPNSLYMRHIWLPSSLVTFADPTTPSTERAWR